MKGRWWKFIGSDERGRGRVVVRRVLHIPCVSLSCANVAQQLPSRIRYHKEVLNTRIMKWIEQLLPSSRFRVALAASLALGLSAFAQTPAASQTPPADQAPAPTAAPAKKQPQVSSSSNAEHDSSVKSRWWAGVYVSGTPFGLVSTHNYTDPAGDYYTSTKAGGITGGGFDFNFRAYRDFWLNVGAEYRYAGFDTNELVNDVVGTVYATRVRSRFYDFPLFVRYAGPKWHWSKYSFYELGGVVRYASSPQVSYAASDVNGQFCCAPPAVYSFNHLIGGVAVGTGLVAKDDFGIKVAPEVRYVRWLGNTFSSSTVGTMRDQLEVGISFGF